MRGNQKTHRLGLQRRIMIYAVVGLGLMFLTWGFVSRNSIDQVTELLLQERLVTAQSIAASFAADLLHIRSKVSNDMANVDLADEDWKAFAATENAFNHLTMIDELTYFEIEGLILAREDGPVVAKIPESLTDADIEEIAPGGNWPINIYSTTVNSDGKVKILVRMPIRNDEGIATLSAYALVRAISSTDRLVGFRPADESNDVVAHGPTYHLEVINHQGLAVLDIGTGPYDSVGKISTYWQRVRNLVQTGSPGIVLEERDGEDISLAVVPIVSSRLYLLAMRHNDTAVGAPARLQDLFVLLGIIGFAVALLIVTVTTRRIVRSTSQLTIAARRMAMGDLDSPVVVWAQDEISQLAESIETMRIQLARAREQTLLDNQELERRVAERTDQLRRALGQVISAQEEERKRVARDLHDGLAQEMVILTRRLDQAQQQLKRGEVDQAELEELSNLSRASLASVRDISRALRPSVLDDLGLVPALSWVANEFKRRTDIEVEQHLPDTTFTVADEPTLILFRAAQEAFANIGHHSGATRASIFLSNSNGAIELRVSDNGKGFDVPSSLPELARQGHLGIIGMRERVELVGGKLKIESDRQGTPDQYNTTVTAIIPLEMVE